MNSQQLKKIGLPDKPGVYFFLGRPEGLGKNGSILYIGKATSLRDRVKSYFSKDIIVTRGSHILDMTVKADKVEWQETDSVLEALILEANLIKKFKPKYNTKEKDNKSFNYVCITRPARPHDNSGAGGDKLPRVLIIRGRGLDKKLYSKIYGPFPNGQQLKEAMKIIRRIFPYFDNDSLKRNNREFYKQIGLIPSVKIALQKHQNSSRFTLKGSDADKNFDISVLQSYKNNIKNLKLFFEGKKKSIIINLKKEMLALSKSKDFESAARIRDQIYALNHINDVALIKENEIAPQEHKNSSRFTLKGSLPDNASHMQAGDADKNFHIPVSLFRIEAYDVAHMGGKNMVGVMTVVEDGEVNKSEYKKFIIRTQSDANDTGALEEILSRRLRHLEWGLPSLIVVDGSTAQVNVAKRVLNRHQFTIPIVGVVKDERHKPKAIIGDEKIIKIYKKQILLANSEAHRFSIAFHKQKRNKSFLNR